MDPIRCFYFIEKTIGFILAFPSLMACTGQQFAVLMFSHFFPSFFNDAAQLITSFLKYLNLILYH